MQRRLILLATTLAALVLAPAQAHADMSASGKLRLYPKAGKGFYLLKSLRVTGVGQAVVSVRCTRKPCRKLRSGQTTLQRRNGAVIYPRISALLSKRTRLQVIATPLDGATRHVVIGVVKRRLTVLSRGCLDAERRRTSCPTGAPGTTTPPAASPTPGASPAPQPTKTVFADPVTHTWATGGHFQSFAADFNGDKILDIGLRRVTDGIFYMRHGPGFKDQISYTWAAGEQYQAFAADMNGDGRAEIGLRHATDGMIFWRFGPSFAVQGSYAWAGGTNYQPFAGDLNGDGKAEIGLRHLDDGMMFWRPGPDFSTQNSYSWAAGSTYQPFAADFTGDGRAEIGIRDAGLGLFLTKDAATLEGGPSWEWERGADFQAFAGDADGDGRADIGLRRISTGVFTILKQRQVPAR